MLSHHPSSRGPHKIAPRAPVRERPKQRQLEDFSSLGVDEHGESQEDDATTCGLPTLRPRNVATVVRHDPTQLPSPLEAEKGGRKLR